jgi:outer membrane lipoprotein SlyB
MARSHHRKKHKQHLQQFKHSRDINTSKAKGKAAGVFTFGGAVVGLATGFFASNGQILWIIVGTIAGGLTGYLIGRKMDRDSVKK